MSILKVEWRLKYLSDHSTFWVATQVFELSESFKSWVATQIRRVEWLLNFLSEPLNWLSGDLSALNFLLRNLSWARKQDSGLNVGQMMWRDDTLTKIVSQLWVNLSFFLCGELHGTFCTSLCAVIQFYATCALFDLSWPVSNHDCQWSF